MTTEHQPIPGPEPDDSLDKALFAAFEDEDQDQPQAITSAVRSTLRALGRVSRTVRLADPDGESSAGAVAGDDGTDEPATDGGRYAVSGEVGRGGIGVVLKARDVDLGRDVAIKVLRKQFLDDDQMVARFVEEAQIGGQLEHPGIVPVHELGLHADQRPYMAMRLVRGQTLASLLKDRPTVDADRRRFLSIFEKVVDTIAYAHARGVIHRDLKPANIMVGAFGEIQVMDWGMAKVLHRQADPAEDARDGATTGDSGILGQCAPPERSRAGSVMGTPAYMAPEQARGEVEKLDARTDVFSLGAILCEILTGAPPFRGGSATAARDQAVQALLDPAFDRLEASSADPELVRIARHCLAPEQAARPADAREVGDRLRAHLSAVDERVRRAEITAAEARVRVRAERKARRLTAGLAAAVLLALLIAGASYLWIDGNRRARVARATASVNEALEDVAEFLGEARAAPMGELAAWAKLRAALDRAGAVADQRDVEPAARVRLAAVEATVEEEEAKALAAAQQADRDARMVRRLDEIFHQLAGSAERRDALYRAAFRDYGIGVPKLDDESVTQRVRASAVRAQLISALDNWAHSLRRTDKALQRRILSISLAADPDAFRSKVRRAILDENTATLVRLATTEGVELSDPRTLVLIAQTLDAAGKANAAEDLLRRAWERRPSESAYPAVLHFLLIKAQPPRPTEALPFAQIALVHYPASALLWSNYAIVLSMNARHDDAVRAARKSIELDPESGPGAYMLLASRLWDKKQFAEAERVARKAVELDPDGPMEHFCVGETLRLAGKPEGALAEYRTALQLDPEFAQAHCSLGVVHLLAGRLDDAQRAFETALKTRAYRVRTADSIAWVGGSGSVGRIRAESLWGLGETHRRRGDFARAIEKLEEALRVRADKVKAIRSLAAVHRDRGDVAKAVELYRRALSVEPDNWQAQMSLASISSDKRERSRCLEAANDTARREPNNAELLARLGRFHLSRAEFQVANRYYRAAAKAAPDNPRYLVWLAGAVSRAGRFSEAHRVLEQVLDRWPQNAAAHAQLGAVLGQERRFDLAVKHLKAAIARDPYLRDAYRNLGYISHVQGRYQEAVRAFRRCLDLSPRDGGACAALAISLAKIGATDEAIAAYRACLRIDPHCVPAMQGLGGQLFNTRGDVVAALKILEKARELNSDHRGILFNLGVCYSSIGLFREAIEVLEKVVESEPRSHSAWTKLGDNLALSQLDVARSIQAYESALRLQSSDRRTLLKLGAVYEGEGRWDEALRAYRRAAGRGQRQPLGSSGSSDRVGEAASQAVSGLEHMIELAKRADEHVEDSGNTLSPVDRHLLARVCYGTKDFGTAARLFVSALEADPPLAEQSYLREFVAWTIGRAIAVAFRASEPVPAQEVSTWCRQALAWMSAELETQKTRTRANDKKTLRAVLKTMRAWRICPHLGPLRDEKALGNLAPADQKRCREFWARVDALIAELDPFQEVDPRADE